MDTCQSCNLPVKQGQRRCFSCGALIPRGEEHPVPPEHHRFGDTCGKCGALLPEGAEVCLICGSARGSAPFAGTFPVPVQEGPAPLPYPRGQRRPASAPTDAWRRWGGALSALLCAVILVFLGFGVYRQYFDTSGYRARDAIVFLDGDGSLYLQHPGLTQPLRVDGIPVSAADAHGVLNASGNGRYLAYTTAGGTAYLLDLRQISPEDTRISAASVAEGIAGPALFADNAGTLVYLDANGEMHSAGLSGNWLLDTDVDELVAAEGGIVLYTRRESRDSGTRDDLYLTYLTDEGGDWQLIDRNVLQVLDWTNGFSRLLYTVVRSGGDSREEVCIGSFDLRQNSTSTLAADIGPVVDASAETGTIVYLREAPQLWSYRMFLDDDLAAQDALTAEPELEDYPLLAEAVAQYGPAANYGDMGVSEVLLEENAAYQQALLEWEEKQQRDELRLWLHQTFAAQRDYLVLFDLYVCRDGRVWRLDTDLLIQKPFTRESGAVDALHGHAIYETVDAGSLRQLKISELWENRADLTLDLREWYLENTRRELRYTDLTAAPVRLYERAAGGDVYHRQWVVPPAGDGIYFTVGGEDTAAELYFAPYKNGAAPDAVRVDGNVGTLLAPLRGGVLYEDAHGNLIQAREQVLRRFAGDNTAVAGIENNGETLLYFVNYSRSTQIGDLYLANRDDLPLASSASDYIYRSDQLVYIHAVGEDGEHRELYEWRGGNLTLLSRDSGGSLAAPLDQ